MDRRGLNFWSGRRRGLHFWNLVSRSVDCRRGGRSRDFSRIRWKWDHGGGAAIGAAADAIAVLGWISSFRYSILHLQFLIFKNT